MCFAVKLDHLRTLSTEVLQEELLQCRGRERAETAVLIAHLAEVDRRKLYSALGYSSLFAYCDKELGHTEAAAYLRIQVARVACRHPEVLDRLAKGTLNLSVAAAISPILTADNASAILERAEGMTKLQAKEWVASVRPKPSVRSGVRRTPRRRQGKAERALFEGATDPSVHDAPVHDENVGDGRIAVEVGHAQASLLDIAQRPASALQGRMEPARLDTYNFRFCADRALKDKIERLGEVIGIRDPFAALGQIVSKAVDAALDQRDPRRRHERRQRRTTARKKKTEEKSATLEVALPGAQGPSPLRRRTIPVAIRDGVLDRAGYRCEFRSAERRCTERTGLQIDHVLPFGKGGSDQESNLQVLCAHHNQWKAKEDYGRTYVDNKIALSQALVGSRAGSASHVSDCGSEYYRSESHLLPSGGASLERPSRRTGLSAVALIPATQIRRHPTVLHRIGGLGSKRVPGIPSQPIHSVWKERPTKPGWVYHRRSRLGADGRMSQRTSIIGSGIAEV